MLQVLVGLWRSGPRGWPDAARAAAALWRARRQLASSRFRHAGLDLPSAGAGPDELTPAQIAVVERVRQAVPRVANRFGWQRDCLIQALAAQAWLTREGVSSRIVLGARSRPEDGFDAHAWLLVGTREVTGWNNGEASGYSRFPTRPADRASRHDI